MPREAGAHPLGVKTKHAWPSAGAASQITKGFTGSFRCASFHRLDLIARRRGTRGRRSRSRWAVAARRVTAPTSCRARRARSAASRPSKPPLASMTTIQAGTRGPFAGPARRRGPEPLPQPHEQRQTCQRQSVPQDPRRPAPPHERPPTPSGPPTPPRPTEVGSRPVAHRVGGPAPAYPTGYRKIAMYPNSLVSRPRARPP